MIYFFVPLAYIGKFTDSSLAIGSGIDLISMLLLMSVFILTILCLYLRKVIVGM